jgi:hypothetical protein
MLMIASVDPGLEGDNFAAFVFEIDPRKEWTIMAHGLTTIASSLGAKVTMDRLEAEVKAKGLTVFARVDHAGGAATVGLPLRPTEVHAVRGCS